MNCKNHPAIQAKRKCFQCGDPICSICHVRGSHHIFCSQKCQQEYLGSHISSPSSKSEPNSKRDKLIPGTPHVDSAYFMEKTPINIRNVNLETFEAIQKIIEKTDKELKAYLNDLELIFESSSSESLNKLKAVFEEKWKPLTKNLDEFRMAIANSAKELGIIQENLVKGDIKIVESLQKITSIIEGSSKNLDGKIDKIESDLRSDLPQRFGKIISSLSDLSSTVDGKIANLKELFVLRTEKTGADLHEIEKRFSGELSENFTGFRSQLESRMTSLQSSIDVGREKEQELLSKNEEKIKTFLDLERKYVDELLTDYHKRITLNLNANKERIAQTISSGGTEIKDFLDFQRLELFKSVSRLGENLEIIFNSSENRLSLAGLELNKTLKENLKEGGTYINESLDAFEGGLADLLDTQRKSVENYLTASEDEQKSLLTTLATNLEEALTLQRSEYEKSLSSQGRLISDLLDTTRKSLDNSLKNQNVNFNQALNANNEQVKLGLDAVGQDIKAKLDGNTSQLANTLSTTYSSMREALVSAENKIDTYVQNQREKLLKFIEESYSNEKVELGKLLSLNQTEINNSLEKLTKELSSSNSLNRETLENFIKAKIGEIDGIIQNQISEIQTNLDLTVKNIGDYSNNSINSFIAKSSFALEHFESQIKSHAEKREKILIDEMACLVVSNKGNMEEILNRARVDLEAQIKNVERESGKLLKSEITKSVDVFNLNLSSLLGEIKDNLKKKVRAIPSQFSLSSPIKVIIVLVMLLVILNPILGYINSSKLSKILSSKVDDLASRIGESDGKNAVSTTAILDKGKVEESGFEKPRLIIRDNFTTSHDKITLKGESKFGDFVLLSINDEWKSLKFLSKNRFLFENVELVSGENKIEVTAFTILGKKSQTEIKQIFFNRIPLKIYNLAYNISRGDIRKPQVALTFDGGSNAFATPFILNNLKVKGIKTTMFLTGDFIAKNPELTRQIVELGHEVGNHTYSHPHLLKNYNNKYQKTALSKAEFEQELTKTRELFRRVTGNEMAPFWRAPYGEINDDVLTWAKNLGYTNVRWTTREEKAMDSLDWVEAEESKLYRTAEEIKNAILGFDEGTSGGSNGSIIIMHLGTNRSTDQPYSKLSEIIDGMIAKGYQFTKVSAMMESFNPRKFVSNK